MSAIIGITTGSSGGLHDEPFSLLPHAYIQAILEAGGVPVMIPTLLSDAGWKRLYPHLDGILFSGGGDIDVGLYGGKQHPAVNGADPFRDALELSLLRAAAYDDKPFLGICRGCQVVNVGFGGTLYTHLPEQLPGALDHDRSEDGRPSSMHEAQVELGTMLSGILSEFVITVNSHHHQGLCELGAALRVAARAPDGLVEAVELPDHPFGVAVQWHPERLLDQPHARSLFGQFVGAAAEYHE